MILTGAYTYGDIRRWMLLSPPSLPRPTCHDRVCHLTPLRSSYQRGSAKAFHLFLLHPMQLAQIPCAVRYAFEYIIIITSSSHRAPCHPSYFFVKLMMNLKLVVNAGSLTTISSPSASNSPNFFCKFGSVCLRKLSGVEK